MAIPLFDQLLDDETRGNAAMAGFVSQGMKMLRRQPRINLGMAIPATTHDKILAHGANSARGPVLGEASKISGKKDARAPQNRWGGRPDGLARCFWELLLR